MVQQNLANCDGSGRDLLFSRDCTAAEFSARLAAGALIEPDEIDARMKEPSSSCSHTRRR
jgi:hypothetical protein